MMGRRTLGELLHLAAGLGVTAAVFAAASWSYPVGRGTIRLVGGATMLIMLAMAVAPLRRAWRGDAAGGRSERA